MLARVINPEESVIYKGEIYACGDEFEVDEAIGKSLIERGYIEGITDNPNLFAENEVMDVTDIEEDNDGDDSVDDDTDIKEGVEIRDDIESMAYPELKSYASQLGLSGKGSKEELIARIKEHFGKLEEVETEDEESEDLPVTSMPEE